MTEYEKGRRAARIAQRILQEGGKLTGKSDDGPEDFPTPEEAMKCLERATQNGEDGEYWRGYLSVWD